jgi:hypothetical protein
MMAGKREGRFKQVVNSTLLGKSQMIDSLTPASGDDKVWLRVLLN